MTDSYPAPREEEATVPEPAQESSEGFRAEFPLAVLESVRQHDRPAEVLEDEDLARSLPRRLGLTGVVDSQIHRYRTAQKRRDRVSMDQVGDLLRLVLRRPDAEAILREAGHALARTHGFRADRRLGPAGRLVPGWLRQRLAERNVRRFLRRIGGGVPVQVERAPFRVRMDRPVTARVDRWGVACVLYGAAIEQVVSHVMGRRPDVQHTACEAKGADHCIWTIDVDG